jgi:RNA polymerase sigma-70 factor (ECF subfamily)
MIEDTLYTYRSCRLRRDLSDQATIQLVQSGHVEAVGLLFERYSRLVLSVATRILRDRAEAQDLLQDVFLYILRRGYMFDPARGTVVSWVLQLTYSKSLNRRSRYMARPLERQVPIDLATHIADPEMGPERAAEKLSAGKFVHLALAGLTEAQRETLCLYFFEGYSLLEVSKKRSERLGNTRHHFYRGMAALRFLLKSSDRMFFAEMNSSPNIAAFRNEDRQKSCRSPKSGSPFACRHDLPQAT